MTTIIQNENVNIGSIYCNVFATERPEVLLIQPSARHETKNDGINREVKVLAATATKGFAIVFFDTVEWAKALMPWQDEAVSRNEEVGIHAQDTLVYIEESLVPCIIRKTKRFAIPERAVYFLKTKRTAGGTPPPQNIFDRLTPVFT